MKLPLSVRFYWFRNSIKTTIKNRLILVKGFLKPNLSGKMEFLKLFWSNSFTWKQERLMFHPHVPIKTKRLNFDYLRELRDIEQETGVMPDPDPLKMYAPKDSICSFIVSQYPLPFGCLTVIKTGDGEIVWTIHETGGHGPNTLIIKQVIDGAQESWVANYRRDFSKALDEAFTWGPNLRQIVDDAMGFPLGNDTIEGEV